MATSDQTTTALLTEHFRYTPLTLLDDVINTVNELVFRGINAVNDGLSNMPAAQLGFRLTQAQNSTLTTVAAREDALEQQKQDEIDTGIIQLESLLNATVDRDFDKFEIYTLRNILAVGHPPSSNSDPNSVDNDADLASWVRLDHYNGIVDFASTTKDSPTPEQVQLQRRKLHETAKLNSLLKAEEAKYAAILSQLTTFLSGTNTDNDTSNQPLTFLNPSNPSTQSLTQDTRYALSQLATLQNLQSDLRAAIKRMPTTIAREEANADDREDDSLEGRRRRYLVTQSRRALERRGIDVDASTASGEGVGGTGAAGALSTGIGGSRKIAREDVEGIEAVASVLGAGRMEE